MVSQIEYKFNRKMKLKFNFMLQKLQDGGNMNIEFNDVDLHSTERRNIHGV